jgi:hypothetical protein
MLGSVFAEGHSNNSLFEEGDPIHRYNPTYTNRLLRDEFREKGIELNTADLNAERSVDFELHFEGRPLGPGALPRFLVALENPVINPLNADASYLSRFRRVFTWNPRFAGLDNVTRICVPNRLAVGDWPRFGQRKIFSCLINANKRFKLTTPNDLYEERVAVVRWYERNASDHFELYGLGWNKPWRQPGPGGAFKRRLERLGTQLFGYRPFPSWRGEIADKASVLLRAKFAYCYENISGISGYVTEKLFDCLVNGCVPIYWGADDIAGQVPADCFIDRREFRDTAAVHAHLLSITAEEFERRQEAIGEFLRSKDVEPFSSRHFVRLVVDGVTAELGFGTSSPGEPVARLQQRSGA